ncbi:glycosyl transferase, group 1 [Liquorilactobacillus aquaticus DSM 21051]|uniref:Glycosyl transferase, group 1 n=2 Tax=Liquorilactobacillus aquaticus TaxID=392566 RepID=A0A0R2D0Q9_9LACO|nr:glycosyl transferase, group 1 [Liquorilactobacillus aquaticus DSM 21051]
MAQLMKVLIVLENVVMDGVKRAATVVGNDLAKYVDVTYYSLEKVEPYYVLDAPLVTAKRTVSAEILNFFGANPYEAYADQISDLCDFIEENAYEAVILPAGLLTSFSPFIKKATPNVNVIAWMHNNFDTYMEQYYASMQEEFKRGLEFSDTVVVLTDADYARYRQFNNNTVKIYNPLTLEAPKKADLKSHIIAFTGRIAIQHKGIDFLLEAAQSLPKDWKIAIAGSGTPKDMEIFHGLIKKFGVKDKIIYRGALKDEELRQHYESASIFVSTSRWEGMPLVMGEAMGFGLPIVAMKNTGSDEYLRDDRYGIITKPHDVKDFVRVLDKMTRSLFLRRYYSERSLERIQHFMPETITKQWLPVIATPKNELV